LCADWSLGRIYAVQLKRRGGSYDPSVEIFCSGNPMNVTDLAVAPDGCVYFTTGGRGTQGGVFRIERTDAKPKLLSIETDDDIKGLFLDNQLKPYLQPMSAWGRRVSARAIAWNKEVRENVLPIPKWDQVLMKQLNGSTPTWNELGDESKNG